MEDLVITTDTVSLLKLDEQVNTVRVVESEPVLITTDTGSIITLASESTVVLQAPTTNILVTGLVGPPGPTGTPEDETMFAKRVDFVTDDIMYRGEAAVGSSDNLAVWRIRKIVIGSDGDVTETWASGNANFDKAWSDRASLTYI